MGERKKRRGGGTWLEAYRRVRKPMPPPERVTGDERRKICDDAARREIREVE